MRLLSFLVEYSIKTWLITMRSRPNYLEAVLLLLLLLLLMLLMLLLLWLFFVFVAFVVAIIVVKLQTQVQTSVSLDKIVKKDKYLVLNSLVVMNVHPSKGDLDNHSPKMSGS